MIGTIASSRLRAVLVLVGRRRRTGSGRRRSRRSCRRRGRSGCRWCRRRGSPGRRAPAARCASSTATIEGSPPRKRSSWLAARAVVLPVVEGDRAGVAVDEAEAGVGERHVSLLAEALGEVGLVGLGAAEAVGRQDRRRPVARRRRRRGCRGRRRCGRSGAPGPRFGDRDRQVLAGVMSAAEAGGASAASPPAVSRPVSRTVVARRTEGSSSSRRWSARVRQCEAARRGERIL